MRRLSNLFLHTNVDALRFFLAASSLAWGALLLMPGDTFDRPTYALMRAMGPEWAWAAAHALHGAAAMWALLGPAQRSRVLWAAGPLLGCLLWTTSAVAMMASVYPLPAAIAPHLVGAAASWWLLVRDDHHHKEGCK